MTHYRHLIIGAGISGLTLGWHLSKSQPSLAILDSANRAGGWIRTIHENGFLFELGPRSFRMQGRGETTLKLVDELGLTKQLIVPCATSRFLYYQGKVRPLNLLSLMFTSLGKGIASAVWNDLTLPSVSHEESINAFFSRRFNSAIADRFVDPLVSGIFAGDPCQLSMSACFPCMSTINGSLIKAALRRKKTKGVPFYSFRNGMETLPAALAARLDDHLHLNVKASKITCNNNIFTVTCTGGRRFTTDNIYCALPASRLAPLLDLPAPEITCASIAVVNLGYNTSVLRKKGFGYLIPSSERQKVLGVVWDSSVFPQHNCRKENTRLTVMIGGARQPDLVWRDDQNLGTLAMNHLAEHLNIRALPDAVHIYRASEAIPQYTLGHIERVAAFRRSLPPRMHLLGSSYEGVSINDCIYQAQQTASLCTT